MPKYEYACKSCGEHLEVVQSFKDDALTDCPSCGGALRKVFGSIGIAFKGSGFYRTDNRSAPPKSERSEKSEKSESTAGKSDTKSEGTSGTTSDGKSDAGSAAKPDAKPAAKSEAKSA